MNEKTTKQSQCLIIAEIAQAHDGSLGTAHAYIDAVADAGADAIKFQTHIASAESTPGEPWRVKFSPQDDTRFDYWQRMEFSEEHWHGLKKHADDRGLKFLSSPFSVEAVELLTRVGVFGWKIASGELSNAPMFDRIAETGLPVIMSSGMSSLAELDQSTAMVRDRGLDLTLLQCTSMYPTPPEHIGLNMLPIMRHRYSCDVGLSDHSGTIYPGLAAAMLGISMLEIHVTMSREMFGPDVVASVTTTELKQLVEGLRFIETMRLNPVDKDAMADELAPMRRLFNKSVVAKRDMPSGAVLTRQDLTVKKPGTGIPASRIDEPVGKRLCKPLNTDDILQTDHVENS